MKTSTPPIRKTLVTLTMLASLLALPSTASAKDMNGRLGVGMETSLGGISGVTLRFWALENFGIQLTAGFKLLFEEVSTGGSFGTSAGASLGVVYNFSQSAHANLGIGLRAGFAYNSTTMNKALNPDAEGDLFQLLVEGPVLTMEFFLSDQFSMSASTGVLFNWVSDSGSAVTPPGQEGLDKADSLIIDFGGGGFSASIGLVYYF